MFDLEQTIRERHSVRLFLSQPVPPELINEALALAVLAPSNSNIPAELSTLCGVAIGYPDPDFPANKLHVGREPLRENIVFLDK
jgi:nitroreductase